MRKNIKINKEYEEARVDKWLKRKFSSLTQSFIEKNLRKGFIKINNKKIKANYKVKNNDIVNIYNFLEKNYSINDIKKPNKKVPKKIMNQFWNSIIFENDDFIIIDKWDNIVTQGVSKINISINDIIKNISEKYNLVHRLDRYTSGLLIISKNYKTTKSFGKLFKEQKIEKNYLAICEGNQIKRNSIVNLKLIDKNNSNKYADSITKYKVLLNRKKISVILFAPLTGKTHQLRILSKKLGSPIIGDNKYNCYSENKYEKLKLNAYNIKFVLDKKEYNFRSKLPIHFYKFFENKKINFDLEKIFTS